MAHNSDKDELASPVVSEVSDNQKVSDILRDYPPKPWYQDSGALKLYGVLFPGALLVSSTVGFEGSMMNGVQALTQFNSYFDPSAAISGLINSTYWLGASVAYPVSQWVGDKWGRKRVIYIGTVIAVISAVLQGAAQNLAMFIIARILFGFTAIFSGNAASVLVAESVHPRDRRVISSLYNAHYYIGAIIAAWVTYGTANVPNTYAWRIPSYLQCVMALTNALFLRYVPESPRWLVANGHTETALEALANGHASGDKEDKLVRAELREIKDDLDRQRGDSPWRDLISGPKNRKRLFLLVFIGFSMNWSGNGLVSYYLSRVLSTVGVKSEDDQTLINGILSIVSFVTCLVASWASGWVRRRTQWLSSALAMLLSFITVTIASSVVENEPDNKPASMVVIVFVFFFMCGYNWAFNPLAYAWPNEILPYNLRLVGVSTVLFACTLAGFFNQWVNPIAMEAITWRYYIVYVAWLTVEVLVIFFTFPETSGQSLEETSALLEEDTFITKLRRPVVNLAHGQA